MGRYYRQETGFRYDMTRSHDRGRGPIPDLHRSRDARRITSRIPPFDARCHRCDSTDMSSLCCSSEDDRRERDRRERRRNELRGRVREAEEEEDVEERRRRRKKSGTARVCGWAKCCFGSAIALGLLFAFFVITTLIIDGNSPLDYFIFKTGEDHPGPSSNSSDIGSAYDNRNITRSVKNSTDNSSNNGEKNTKGTKGGVTETSLSENSELSTEVNLGIVIQNHVLEPETYPDSYLRPGLQDEDSDREITYIKGPSGRSYAAYAPVPLDVVEKLEKKLGRDQDGGSLIVKVNRYGEIEDVRSDNKSPPEHVYVSGSEGVNRKLDKNHNRYDRNRRTKQKNSGSDLIPSYALPPANNQYNRGISSRNSYPQDTRRGEITKEPYPYDIKRNYHAPVRPVGDRRDELPSSSYNPRRYLRVNPQGPEISKRTYPRGRYEGRSSSRYNVDSRDKGHSRNPYPRNRYSSHRAQNNRDRSMHESSKRRNSYTDHYRPRSRSVSRPPREFRYPPSSKSIQDIISYMNKREDEETKTLPEKEIDRNYGKEYFEIPHGHVIGDQDHILENGRYVPRGTFSHEEKRKDVNLDSYKTHPDITYNHRDYTFDPVNKHESSHVNTRNQNVAFNDRRTIPPVHNTYDPYAVEKSSRDKEPLKIMLDIYPVNEPHTSRSNIMRSSLSIAGGYMPRDKSTHPQVKEKQEVILHLNLFTKKPSHNSGSSVPYMRRRSGVSLEIPLSGNLTPLDIYKSIVQQVKKTPVASPQSSSSSGGIENYGIELLQDGTLNLESRTEIFDSLREGLRKVNSLLPTGRKILSMEPVTKETLISAERDVEELLLLHPQK